MPVPVNRSKIMPARGTKAVLEESLASLLEGEMAYATDEKFYYQKQGGVLVAVGAPNASAMTILTDNVDTTDGEPLPEGTRGLMKVIPPDLPAGWTELTNQREVNWWIHREIENVANRTTITEQQLRDQADRIYALENVEGPEVDLEGYALTTYVDAQDKAISDRLQAVELTYCTTGELAPVSNKADQNAKDIGGLQECFDAAVLAAQEGAENLTIELTSYAKKEDTYTKAQVDALIPEVPEPISLDGYASVEYVDQQDGAIESRLKAVEQDYTTAQELTDTNQRITDNKKLIDANAEAIKGLESGEGPDLSDYALKSELPTDNAQLANGAGYLTESDLPDAPEAPDLSAYASIEYVDAADDQLKTEVGSAASKADKAMEKANANAEAIAAIEIPEVPPAPDLSGYATTADLATATAGLPYKIETDKVLRSADAPPKLSRAADGIATAHAGGEIQLVDGEGYFSNITFSGVGGVQTQSDQQGIIIDGSGVTDPLALKVNESEDSSFDIENPEQPQRDAEAEAGTMAVLPNIQLLNGETDKGRVWFQGGGGTGVSLDGSTIRVTTTQLNNRSKSNEDRLNKITPADDEMGRVTARAGQGTAALYVRNASADNAETFSVNGGGDVVAKSFEGDGSKLTGLPPAQIDWNNLPNLTT